MRYWSKALRKSQLETTAFFALGDASSTAPSLKAAYLRKQESGQDFSSSSPLLFRALLQVSRLPVGGLQ